MSGLDSVQVTERTLEKVRLGCELAMSRHVMEARAELLERWAEDRISIQVRGYIWGEKLGSVMISWPADWWEAVKLRFAPHWFTRRYPVRFAHRTVDCKALYPDYRAIFPDQKVRFASFAMPEVLDE